MGVNILQKLADILANAVLTVYLLAKGFSYVEITVFWSVYLASVCIFDFPSGAFADRIGRVKSYYGGVFLSAISYIILLISFKRYGYICSYFIKGIGTALMSGSLHAWFGSEFSHEQYKKYLGRIKLYEIVIIVPVVLALTTIKEASAENILYIVIVIQIIMGICAAIILPDNKGAIDTYFKVSIAGLKNVFSTKALILGLSMSIVSYVLFTVFNLFWQPYAVNIGVKLSFFPLLSAINIFISSATSYVISRLKIPPFVCMNISYSFFVAGFLSLLWKSENNILGLICFWVLYSVASGVLFITISCIINENADNNNKATVFSVISSVCSLITIVFQPVVGVLMQEGYSVLFTATLGVLCVVIVISNLMAYGRKK